MATTVLVYEAPKQIAHDPPTMVALFEQNQRAEPTPRAEPAPAEPVQKVEREPMREPVVEPKPIARELISDTVSQQVMAAGQPTFLACYRRALKRDPLLGAVKVTIEADVDPSGVVTDVRTDASDTLLSACFGRVVRALVFPAPDQPAVSKLVFIAS